LIKKRKRKIMKIHFKKILVSILVIAGFVFYAVYQHFNTGQPNLAGNQQDNSSATNTSTETVANVTESQSTQADTTTSTVDNTTSSSGIISGDDGEYGDDGEGGNLSAAQTTQTTNAPTSTTNAGTNNTTSAATTTTTAPTSTTSGSGLYKDGQYDGVTTDAYYGIVQVRAIIQGGKLTDVQFLSYPSDRSYSREVNNIAMPILKSEAIKAQSAQVNAVSGATNTSRAFIQSLSSALNAAKV
jgi:uncharacterized protein with FMN-binding domain